MFLACHFSLLSALWVSAKKHGVFLGGFLFQCLDKRFKSVSVLSKSPFFIGASSSWVSSAACTLRFCKWLSQSGFLSAVGF
jgi:hypothetical protein